MECSTPLSSATGMDVQETQTSSVERIPRQPPQRDTSPECSSTHAALAVLLWTAAGLAFGSCIWILATRRESLADGPAFYIGHNETAKSQNRLVVCDTDDCHRFRFLLTLVDKDLDPCENFYSFVCHKMTQTYPWWFVERRVSPLDQETITVNTISENITEESIRYLYNTLTPRRGQTPSQRPRAYFQHCVFEGGMEHNRNTILEFLNKRGLVFEGENPSFDPLDTMAQLLFQTTMPALFGMPGIRPLGFNPVPAFIRASFEEEDSTSVAGDLRALGIPEDRAEDLARDIGQSIAFLKNYSSSESEELKVSFSQLGFLTNDTWLGKRWAEIFRAHGEDRVPGNASLVIRQDDLRLFLDIFGRDSKFDRNSLRLYIAWRTLSYLLEKIRVDSTLHNCWLLTLSVFQYDASADVLLRKVNRFRIDSLYEMMNSISVQVRRAFDESDWIDDSTRNAAKKKLDSMKLVLSGSAWSGLAGKISADLTGPYLSDVLKVDAAVSFLDFYNTYHRKSAARLTAADSFGRLMAIFGFNTFNVITFSMPIMLSPLFTYGGPPSVNYGALGAAIAHEIMHGFNSYGMLDDGHGNPVRQWSEGSTQNYTALVNCNQTIIEPLKEWSFEDAAPEYLSDVMGQEPLYKAYKKASEASAVTLGDVTGFTEDQLFFISSCFGWCGVGEMELGSDHPPHDERCNLPLMNSARFSEAFSCPPGSTMNPVKKCPFW